MRSVTRIALGALWTALARAPLLGQGTWVPPRPPCELSAGHFKVNGGVLYLKTAAEKPNQRAEQLVGARRVLTEAIVQDHQDQNPAAWYYLGRYYYEVGDAAGVDSTFRRALALAPKCAEDLDRYREDLWARTYNAALAAWQENKDDSAVVGFHRAAQLAPTNPKAFAALASFYSAKNNEDSAIAYYRRAATVAGTDTTFAKDRKDALTTAWHIAVNRAQSAPAVQEVPGLRVRLDSITRALAGDSAVLAKIVAASQARKARRGTLAPADQRVFTRDSTTRAQAVAAGRTARAAVLAQLAADSAALAGAFAPAVAALREYVAAYPDALDAATWLATLYAQGGRATDAVAVFDSLAAHTPGLDPSELLTTGERLVNQGLYRAGSRALALALERNPYNRGALYALGVAYYQLRDSTHLLPVAQQLVALDPLNRATLRLVATGWDLRSRRDSTLAYLARADTGLALEVVVSAFVKSAGDADFTALATNHKAVPSKPLHLTFEFVDEHGQVIATLPYDVPSLPAGATHEINLKASGKGIAGWRYRAS